MPIFHLYLIFNNYQVCQARKGCVDLGGNRDLFNHIIFSDQFLLYGLLMTPISGRKVFRPNRPSAFIFPAYNPPPTDEALFGYLHIPVCLQGYQSHLQNVYHTIPDIQKRLY